MNTRMRRLLFYLLLIITWETVYRLQIWSPVLFPSPLTVSETLAGGFADGTFLIAIAVSMRRILVGYLLALLIGVSLGFLIARYKVLEDTFGSLVVGLQAVPSVVWLPLALIWMGMSEKAIIFITCLGATWTMLINTDAGVKNTPPIYLRAARSMGAGGSRLFWHVVLPAAVPSIITGMRLAWAFAWRALMAGELLSSGTGLGQILMMGRNINDMSQVIAVMVIIGVVGCLADHFIFKKLENSVRCRWGLITA
ncbi:MAG: ABC transporter permease [Bacillota bacterium]